MSNQTINIYGQGGSGGGGGGLPGFFGATAWIGALLFALWFLKKVILVMM